MAGKNIFWIIITAVVGFLAGVGGWLFSRRRADDNSGIVSRSEKYFELERKEIRIERENIERERAEINQERAETERLGSILDELEQRSKKNPDS
jgi:hypothetical protein